MLHMSKSLIINSATSLLAPVTYRVSPHHDDRPQDILIDMVVVHNISLPPGEFGTNFIEDFFVGTLDHTSHPYFATITHIKACAHLLIKRTGEIIQFVPFDKRAWHAGESFYNGKSRCNDFSVGIELEGTDEVPYESQQYEQLINVVQLLMQAYPAITKDRIVGHVDIAPSRKTDPGPSFDWDYLRGRLV
jgi:AmpD protein